MQINPAAASLSNVSDRDVCGTNWRDLFSVVVPTAGEGEAHAGLPGLDAARARYIATAESPSGRRRGLRIFEFALPTNDCDASTLLVLDTPVDPDDAEGDRRVWARLTQGEDMVSVFGRTPCFAYLNQRLLQRLNAEPGDVIGRDLDEVLRMPAAGEHSNAFGAAVVVGRATRVQSVPTHLGSNWWAETHFAPLTDRSGHITDVVGFSRVVVVEQLEIGAQTTTSESAGPLPEAEVDAVLLLDADLQVLAANSVARGMLVGDAESDETWDPFACIAPGAPERAAAHAHAAASSGSSERYVEYRDGHPLIMSLTPVIDSDGQLARFVAVVQRVAVLASREYREVAMAAGLRTVVAIADQLMAYPSMDQLLRDAVRIPRERLGIERCSIFLDDGGKLRGTYGTDMQGHTTDEHAAVIEEWPNTLALGDMRAHRGPMWSVRYGPIRDVEGETIREVGRGWAAATVIQSGRRPIGIFYNDSAITGAELDPGKQELIAVYCSMLGNIIERRKAVEALRQSEHRYRMLAEAAHDFIFIIGRDDTVEYVNTFAAGALGVDPEQVVGQPRRALFPPEVADQQGKALARVLSSGEPVGSESKVTFPGGDVWLDTHLVPLRDESGEVVSVLGLSRDVTERRKAQSSLRESEETAWALLNASMDVVALIDTEWRVVAANEAAAKLLGGDVEDLIGTDVFANIDPDVVAVHKEIGKRVCQTRRPIRLDERHAGREYAVSLYPVTDAEGQVSRLAVFAQDYTDQRSVQEAQRLTAVGQLAAGVAHEFNNLLANMMLAAEVAGERGTQAAYERLAQVVLHSTGRGAEICEDLVTFARPKQPKRGPMAVEDAIESALGLVARHLEAGDVIVTRQYHTMNRLVHADRGQLEQVFLNLFLNACHAMPDGGTLTITADHLPDVGGNGQILVTVSDTGVGINEDDLPHVFDPFFTTKGALAEGDGQGTGLGLSVSMGIVSAHDGSLEVQSTESKGTTLVVRLPVYGGDLADGQLGSTRGIRLPAREGRRRILVVNDGADLSGRVTEALANRECDVLAVQPGPGAIAALRGRAHDVVVTLVEARGDAGQTIIDVVSSLPKPPPLIVIAGSEDKADSTILPASLVGRVLPRTVAAGEVIEAIEMMLKEQDARA